MLPIEIFIISTCRETVDYALFSIGFQFTRIQDKAIKLIETNKYDITFIPEIYKPLSSDQ